MFCTSCGTEIRENSNFCSKCGSSQCGINNISNVNYSNQYSSNINGSIAMNFNKVTSLLKFNYMEIFKTFFIGMICVTMGAYFGVRYLPYSIVEMINVLLKFVDKTLIKSSARMVWCP